MGETYRRSRRPKCFLCTRRGAGMTGASSPSRRGHAMLSLETGGSRCDVWLWAPGITPPKARAPHTWALALARRSPCRSALLRLSLVSAVAPVGSKPARKDAQAPLEGHSDMVLRFSDPIAFGEQSVWGPSLLGGSRGRCACVVDLSLCRPAPEARQAHGGVMGCHEGLLAAGQGQCGARSTLGPSMRAGPEKRLHWKAPVASIRGGPS